MQVQVYVLSLNSATATMAIVTVALGPETEIETEDWILEGCEIRN